MKKLTRIETKNILMSTLGSDMIGCYNDKQEFCEYYNKGTDCYCAIGMLMSVIDDKFEGNSIEYTYGTSVEGFKIGNASIHGGIDQVDDNDIDIINKLSEFTGLTGDEVCELQSLHDRATANTAKKSKLKVNRLKYETFVATL